jgi:phytoene dehydrogenase-like protein
MPSRSERRDVVVVGAGPNGLAAAIALARAGLSVLVVEACDTPGGGARSDARTLPGFVHDSCSTVHPLGVASPFFRTLGLERHGLAWAHPAAPLAHVLDEDTVVLLERSVAATARHLGPDGDQYRRLLEPFVERCDELLAMILGPLRPPSSPLLLARFGWLALRSMRGLARRFEGRAAPALLAGCAAHAMLPLDAAATASFALVLAVTAHAVGWPVARGGSQAITAALLACLREQGGELRLGQPVARLDRLPPARAYVLDVTPRQLVAIAGDALPTRYRRRLARFRYGPGVFKVDWALRAPVPWRHPDCARAATVHLAGDLAAVAEAESAPHAGSLAPRPFVLFVQPTTCDPTRAPAGMHTAWAYCHVPHGSAVDAGGAIEAQVERFAPGFTNLVVGRAVRDAHALERHDANYIGGDINGGLASVSQLFTRPVARLDPYATPAPNVFLCSSSTPPGGGVHGMCGYWAARSVFRNVFRGDLVASTSPAFRAAG